MSAEARLAHDANLGPRPRKEPGRGTRRGDGRVCFGVEFDNEMSAAIRKRAAEFGISFSEQVRTYCQWGLDAQAEDDRRQSRRV